RARPVPSRFLSGDRRPAGALPTSVSDPASAPLPTDRRQSDMRASGRPRESAQDGRSALVHRPEGRAAALAECRVEIVDGLAGVTFTWQRFGGCRWRLPSLLESLADLAFDCLTVARAAGIQLLHQRD